MKTRVFLVLLAAVSGTPALAQTASPSPTPAEGGELFRQGTLMANLGLGLGTGLGYGSFYGTLSSGPALSLSVERGVAEGIGPGTIGIGGLVGYKSYYYKYPGTSYKSTWRNALVAVRGTYHYNILAQPNLDTYAGASLGVRLQRHQDTYFDSAPELKDYPAGSARFTTGVFVGARYFLTDKLGAFTEIGFDMNYLKLGLTARF
ncbi:hypothetical protein [Hymenobacter persicinus]|uniref:Outer membrane protein beta-barrel domain-containing protein n=1 Tax=Hymenobacter persicinus TaxID=2025506 RepID=A0A4Q5LAC4_9BACT|nr:hypothetical protein [Hymenobacter persicinus]RYU78845.1 hypothetical protein EWM57_12420 [Hymenobacter persicinus]